MSQHVLCLGRATGGRYARRGDDGRDKHARDRRWDAMPAALPVTQVCLSKLLESQHGPQATELFVMHAPLLLDLKKAMTQMYWR